jgi:hypothetical protein
VFALKSVYYFCFVSVCNFLKSSINFLKKLKKIGRICSNPFKIIKKMIVGVVNIIRHQPSDTE